MYVEKFPLNLNGKIDKNALPKPQAILLPDSRYEAVVTDTEERLETIWKDILSVDRIGRKVSFFDIGGTSLKGIKLIARIYKETGILLKVADLFTHPTIQKLAPLVEASQTGSRDDINATSKKDYYEITHSQKRLWLVDQSKKGQTAYNIASVYRLIGNLHMPSFATAIERIVERHESLRTTFHTVEGQPLQRIAPMEAFPAILEILDWRGAQDIEEQTLAITRQKREHAFDLEKGPLFVATLIREKDDRFVFLFTIHHIISDAWSLNVLINDALVSYKSIVRNEPSTLPNLVIQFKDYAEWENRQLAGENVEVLRKFWLQQFAGELFPLKLPTDFTRPGIEPESKGRIWQFELTEAETTALKKLEQTTHVTLFMKLLAVVNVLLSKYSGQKDIIVGIPVANRTDHKLERQVGFYVNTLAVRNTLDVEKSFRHFLQSVQSTLLRIYDHAVYPYDRLLEDLQITLQPGENGLFNVMVQLQDTRSAYQTQELDGLTVQKLDDMERSSKFDLTFNFEEENNVIIVSIEYSIDLFRPETLARYQHDFQTLIRSIIAHPDMTLVELHEGLLTEDQKQRQEQYVQEALTSISEDY
jgi:acyl carrier protein